MEQLPEELLMEVFLQLPLRALVAAGQVCRRWRRVSRDERLWNRMRVDSEQCIGTRSAVRDMVSALRMAPCMRSLRLCGPVFQGERMLRAVRASSCTIPVLDLRGCEEGPWYRALLAQQSGCLHSLHLDGASGVTLVLIAGMPALQLLHIQGGRELGLVPEHPQCHLRTLTVTPDPRGTTSLSRYCTPMQFQSLVRALGASLQELTAPLFRCVTVMEALTSCKQLRKLHVELIRSNYAWWMGAAAGTDISLASLEALPLLEHLAITFSPCSAYHWSLRELPTQIRELRVTFPPISDPASTFARVTEQLLVALPTLGNLTRAELVRCTWPCKHHQVMAALSRAVLPPATCHFLTLKEC